MTKPVLAEMFSLFCVVYFFLQHQSCFSRDVCTFFKASRTIKSCSAHRLVHNRCSLHFPELHELFAVKSQLLAEDLWVLIGGLQRWLKAEVRPWGKAALSCTCLLGISDVMGCLCDVWRQVRPWHPFFHPGKVWPALNWLYLKKAAISWCQLGGKIFCKFQKITPNVAEFQPLILFLIHDVQKSHSSILLVSKLIGFFICLY